MTVSTLNAQPATKYCPACKRDHPITDFDLARVGHADGRQGYCKAVMRERVRQYRRSPQYLHKLAEGKRKRTQAMQAKLDAGRKSEPMVDREGEKAISATIRAILGG